MKILTIGKGQLAMLLCRAAEKQSHHLLAWDLRSEQGFDFLQGQWVSGNFDTLCEQADVITAELEDVTTLEGKLAKFQSKMHPSARALLALAFRDTEKAAMDHLGIRHAAVAEVSDLKQLAEALETLNYRAVIKAVRSGYDGKGQWRCHTKADLSQLQKQIEQFWRAHSDIPLVVERFVPFTAEVSLIGSRDRTGNFAFFPLTTNFHERGILQVSLAGIDFPWNQLQAEAEAIFKKLTESLNYVGTLAIEFFVENDSLIVNEIAPRVHNSGHWTTDGADVSQFDNHILAVTGKPVQVPKKVRPSIMINIIGEPSINTHLIQAPEVSCYWYDKSCRPGRKMGHLNVSTETVEMLLESLDKYRPHWPQNAHESLKQAETLLRGIL